MTHKQTRVIMLMVIALVIGAATGLHSDGTFDVCSYDDAELVMRQWNTFARNYYGDGNRHLVIAGREIFKKFGKSEFRQKQDCERNNF